MEREEIQKHYKKRNAEQWAIPDEDFKSKCAEDYVIDTDKRKYLGHKPKMTE